MKMKKGERDILRTFSSFGVGARIVVTMSMITTPDAVQGKRRHDPRHINSFIAIHF